MANAEIIKETFLVELKDVSGGFYYMRIETAGENYIDSTMNVILEPIDSFITVYSDPDCFYKYNIRRNAIIGYRPVFDLTAG